jgi:ABC transport system ATP-binding/permease protein
MFYLKILDGPKKDQIGTKFPLKMGVSLVGRVSPPADVLLDGQKVSKKHCAFHNLPRGLSVEDLGSSNGTFLNGAKVSKSTLSEKDRLVIGDFTLEVSK